MPEFTVPKFIEEKPKIVGPLTFKQFIFVGTAGAIGFILYFTLGKTNFSLFLTITIVLVVGSLFLAFGKVEGRALPIILQNFFSFFFSPKIYLWRKKTLAPKIFEKVKSKKAMEEKSPTPKVIEKSRLKNLATRIETKAKQ